MTDRTSAQRGWTLACTLSFLGVLLVTVPTNIDLGFAFWMHKLEEQQTPYRLVLWVVLALGTTLRSAMFGAPAPAKNWNSKLHTYLVSAALGYLGSFLGYVVANRSTLFADMESPARRDALSAVPILVVFAGGWALGIIIEVAARALFGILEGRFPTRNRRSS